MNNATQPIRLLLATLFTGTILAGCGGGPSPQDAEAFVADKLGADTVTSVLCEEIDGDRYECEVEWNVGAGPQFDRTIVDVADL